MKKLTAFFLALVTAVTALSVPCSAEAEEVTLFGVTVPADTKEICFAHGDGGIASALSVAADDPGIDACYYIGDRTVDFAEVAKKLPELKGLAVVNCDMTNLGSLTKLKKLTKLGLYNNDETQELPVLKKLTGLKKFDYRNMSCEKLPPLSSLTNLTELAICVSGKAAFSDLSPLKGMTKMKKLRLVYGSFKDLSALKKMTDLRELWVTCSALEDISALKGLKKLKTLMIAQADNVTCAQIAELTGLTSLTLREMAFRDIEELAKLKNLKELTVSNPDERGGSNLYWHVSELTQLESLKLGGLKLFDCKFAKGLTNLKTLWVDDCGVYSLDGMETLTGLTELSAVYNWKIEDISPLAGLTELKTLNLNSNPVKDLTLLKKLKKLEYLGISRSAADPAPILKLKNLKKLYAPDSKVDAAFAEKYQKINPACNITYEWKR